MSARPSRRAAARRQTIVESSDSEDASVDQQDGDEEEFTPAPSPAPPKSARRRTAVRDDSDEAEFTPAPKSARRRKASEVPITPRTVPSKKGRTRASESVEPSVTHSPAESAATSAAGDEHDARKPPKKMAATRRGRRNVRDSRRNRASVAPDVIQPFPPLPASRSTAQFPPALSTTAFTKDANSPQKEQESEHELRHKSPLSDITDGADKSSNIIKSSERDARSRQKTPPPFDPGNIENSTVKSPTSASQEKTPIPEEKAPVPEEKTPKPEEKAPVAEEQTPVAEQKTPTREEKTPAGPTPLTVTRVDAMDALLERPMDIVAKARAAAQPLTQEPEAPKSRICITWLILTNFKSYAGRQEVGPFHASFSSVVGPNGSGKSNVIDSLLFVFGFRASKMRQGKLSALIHNSAQFPNLDHCEVEVHFQEVMDLPEGGHEVIPDSDLVISRRAFKNNSSKYYINGKESNYTVVTTLLRDRGVDLDHKRFLILQGEVESIAQMKAKAANEHDDGLLEYLEDIIGTSKYKTPIEESAAQVETLNEVCQEKNNRVQHVEKEKDSLEDKKNKALAYIRDENELASKQSALYQIFIDDTNDNIQVAQEAINEAQASLDEELERHKGSEEEIKELEKQYKAGSKQYSALDKQTQDFLKELAKLDKETVKFEEKKKFLTNKEKKLQKTLETSKFGTSEAESTIRQCADDIDRNTAEIAELEEQMRAEEEELNSIRESLKGKTQSISDEIAEKQKALEPWNAKINEQQSAMAVAQSELDILREKENEGAKKIADMEARIAGLEEQKATKLVELEECESEKRSTEKEIKNAQKEMAVLGQEEPRVRSKLSSARQKADEARSSLSSTQSQGNVLTGLTRLQESGRIKGFHGRLGNLGTIDQKYDIAISTACPALNNLVVDSVEVGQQCIEYLRKNNLGRANFILLDRLPQRDLSEIDTPENVPRLFDLVRSKHEKFKPAFYSVMQNTLVAHDLQHANRIAYGAKRWRVVTLDGQLIDKSGTMSGGGTRVAKGAMSSKLAADITKEQVAKLEVDRDAVEQQFSDLQGALREGETMLRELSEKIPKLETKAQKIGLEIESYERNMADARRRIKEIAAEQQPSKSDKARMASLEKSIASMGKGMDKLHAETSSMEEEIKALQDRIMEIGGIKLRTQKAKVDGLKEQIDTLNEEMSSAEVNKAKANKQKTKHEKALVEAEKELEKMAAEMEKVDEDMRAQRRDSGGSRQQAEEAQEALEGKKEELSALKADLDAKTTELNETRGIEIEMRNQLEEHQKTLKENQMKLRHWQEKLGKLSLTNVSDLGEEQEVEALPTYTKDELQDMDKGQLKREIASLEDKTQNVQVELGVLGEYRRRVEEHASRSADLATAVAERDAAKKRCDELRRLRLEGFMEGFSTISLRLKEMYQMITMGGNAELELVDSLDPFSEGILFSVMPPKKSWKNISNLSGGEKTLSSLALVFALHHYKPTPLYVMDEIDAALDFRNVSIVASYIKERTKNAQFVVISLRNNMFELASRLVGVYKVNHMTKSVTVENRDYIVPIRA
ncbi:nuclear condensin complex subunit smc4 [Diplodia corticola]|uniref:Structural maintenance of chromosomes protein 4 n=1 Tax=Diplodia corticola TaxID=236234 RepID=A0A1J9S3T0_9PEZI|nr:nuclear condensin complex subunit smc4 [Diplodia corticola]OJD34652.1 nuclear condensin complex subunit smc4 [Diplodia corticola]